MQSVDLIVHSAAQVVTCAAPGGVKRKQALSDVSLITDGGVAVDGGVIVAVGKSADILAAYAAEEQIDATGQVICPGFVDPHTHVVYAGERIGEFEMRLQGMSYLEILRAGGGILSTMRATREATLDDLVAQSRPRLDTMLSLGTTTVEVKTGYGLDTNSELKMLAASEILHKTHPADLVPTFLGAHAVPPEFSGRTETYVDLIVEEMIPAVADWYRESVFFAEAIPFFCDVFCEAGVFDRTQSERILRAGLAHGMAVKMHADEFKSLGGVSLAVELGAISVDHLDVTSGGDIVQLAQSDVVGIVLPAVNFNLGSTHFAPAREMVDAGVAVALATDINPGSAPCPSMPLVMAIACRYQHLLPAEALNASTIQAAHAVGLSARIGSLETGKQADLLILEVNDYRYVSYEFGANVVGKVLKKGKIVCQGSPHLYRFSTIS